MPAVAFGRRGLVDSHLQREGAAIAKRMRGIPVKLVWTREDDVRGGYYRPMFVHRVEVGIGSRRHARGLEACVVGQSFLLGWELRSSRLRSRTASTRPRRWRVRRQLAVQPFRTFHLTAHHPNVNVPVLVAFGRITRITAFVMETLIDELATRAKMDPIAYRRKLLKPEAKKSHAPCSTCWRQASASGATRLPQATMLPAVSLSRVVRHRRRVCGRRLDRKQASKIHRVTVAVHCGLAVNPLTIESQFQGGLGLV